MYVDDIYRGPLKGASWDTAVWEAMSCCFDSASSEDQILFLHFGVSQCYPGFCNLQVGIPWLGIPIYHQWRKDSILCSNSLRLNLLQLDLRSHGIETPCSFILIYLLMQYNFPRSNEHLNEANRWMISSGCETLILH